MWRGQCSSPDSEDCTLRAPPRGLRKSSGPSESNGGVESREKVEQLIAGAIQMVEDRRGDVIRLESELTKAREKLRKAESLLQSLLPEPSLPTHNSEARKRALEDSNPEKPPARESTLIKRFRQEDSRRLPSNISNREPLSDILSIVGSRGSAKPPRVSEPLYLPSQHKRKLRCLALNPRDPDQFVTSALDGYVKFWNIKRQGQSAEIRRSSDCLTPGRKWPESLHWDPEGLQLVMSYSTELSDGSEPQLAILQDHMKSPLFLTPRPHSRGSIPSVAYLPWGTQETGVHFVTGGSDHLVAMWTQKVDGSVKVQKLHEAIHSSLVSCVSGLIGRSVVMSVGLDRRAVAWDVGHSKSAFVHMWDAKLISVAPNPSDRNLLLLQTGTMGHQLRLVDYRAPRVQIHSCGWQSESDSQTAQISASWSPNGTYISAGSTNPEINIFDVRFNGSKPAKVISAHSKRVFKAAWHSSFPLIVSISSDLNIGLLKIDP